MASQLSIYNGALAVLGETKLASLSENREPRYKLDEIWANDFVDRVLKKGQWNFAVRSVQPAESVSVTPAFGHTYAYEKPSDFVRTVGLCQDEFFKVPLTDYTDERGLWFASLSPIYARYVSNDASYGGDLGSWPPDFAEYAEHYLARKVGPRIAGLELDIDRLKELERDALSEAKAHDAMEQPATFAPQSSWVSARRGNGGRQRGNRSTLIG